MRVSVFDHISAKGLLLNRRMNLKEEAVYVEDKADFCMGDFIYFFAWIVLHTILFPETVFAFLEPPWTLQPVSFRLLLSHCYTFSVGAWFGGRLCSLYKTVLLFEIVILTIQSGVNTGPVQVFYNCIGVIHRFIRYPGLLLSFQTPLGVSSCHCSTWEQELSKWKSKRLLRMEKDERIKPLETSGKLSDYQTELQWCWLMRKGVVGQGRPPLLRAIYPSKENP